MERAEGMEEDGLGGDEAFFFFFLSLIFLSFLSFLSFFEKKGRKPFEID